MTTEPLIAIKGLTKFYAPKNGDLDGSLVIKAIDGIDLTIAAGEYVAIVGPSGSGKSTLMQLLGLLDRPTSGTFTFLGKDVFTLSDDELSLLRSRYIGFVFQSFNLLPKLTATENVELPMIYAGSPNRRYVSQELLTQLGLGSRLHHSPLELSGGQQQRVAVARSLANQPPIIFADEPTGNLNQESAREVMTLLRGLNAKGYTIILVTHDPSIALNADRAINIVDGKVQSDRTVPAKPLDGSQLSSTRGEISLNAAQNLPPVRRLDLLAENFKMALKSLSSNKLRTFLSALGIMIGVASVIAMLALGEGAQRSMQEDLKRLGSNVLSVRSGNNKILAKGGKKDSLTIQDAIAVRELDEVGVGIEHVSPEISGNVQVVFGSKNITTRLQGVTQEYEGIYSATPTVGRFFTEEENTERKRVCLLGKTVYENLFAPGENPLGAIIKINRISFQVIGILPTKGGSTFGDRDDVVMTPLLTAMRRVFGKNLLDQISVQVSRYEEIPQISDYIESLLRKRHHISLDRESDFTIRNMAEIQETLASTTSTMTLLLGIIASISLLVGGIGIMNIMLVSVKERTREIGLRKALGAKNSAILVQFLIEAVVIGSIGGITGIMLGVGSSFGVTTFLGWPVAVSPLLVVASFLFSTGIGVLFGYWPAQQASKLSPIEALRHA